MVLKYKVQVGNIYNVMNRIKRSEQNKIPLNNSMETSSANYLNFKLDLPKFTIFELSPFITKHAICPYSIQNNLIITSYPERLRPALRTVNVPVSYFFNFLMIIFFSIKTFYGLTTEAFTMLPDLKR